MVVGYSLGRAYVYSTPAYAWIKLPYEILQALFGVICGPFLVWKWKLDDLARRMIDGDIKFTKKASLFLPFFLNYPFFRKFPISCTISYFERSILMAKRKI